MSRQDMKEIMVRVIAQMVETEGEGPGPGCIFNDGGCYQDNCDATTLYGMNEEG